MNELDCSPLGRPAKIPDRYDPGLLYPVDRAPLRAALGLSSRLPFNGVDQWTAYELGWLDASGKPRVAIAMFAVPAESPRLVESKSVKLYLMGLNQTRFVTEAEVVATLARDLSAATEARVEVTLALPPEFASLPHAEPAGECLDELPLASDDRRIVPEELRAGAGVVDETLYTNLFRSVCPVTGQPDHASVQLGYRGARIERMSLLRYLASFRRQPGFHEHCVERIFVDVWQRCRPESLWVYARFTRRGGIDINPYRTSGNESAPRFVRTARQ